jgi:hypothetical protein
MTMSPSFRRTSGGLVGVEDGPVGAEGVASERGALTDGGIGAELASRSRGALDGEAFGLGGLGDGTGATALGADVAVAGGGAAAAVSDDCNEEG